MRQHPDAIFTFVGMMYGYQIGAIGNLQFELAARPAPAAATEAAAEAESIANGHSWSKHSQDFPGMTQKVFQEKIEETIANATGSNVKQLAGGRTAYWNDAEKMVVIANPNSPDRGTAFRPVDGKAYLNTLH